MKENEEAAIKELVAESGCVHSPALIEEMVQTALRLGRDKASVADLKLFVRAFKEMRYAAKVFQPYANHRKVAVFGSARLKPETAEFQMAEEMGRRLVERDFMVITGGGDGIMGAAQKGAGRDNSFGLNIRLPFEQRANETIHGDKKLINFNYFFTRKVNFVKETDAFVLFPGGFGTQDEGFECLTLMQTGKTKITPLILIDTPEGRYWETWEFFVKNDLLRMKLVSPTDFHLFKIVHNCDEAIDHILQFYKNFVSYRWVREKDGGPPEAAPDRPERRGAQRPVRRHPHQRPYRADRSAARRSRRDGADRVSAVGADRRRRPTSACCVC